MREPSADADPPCTPAKRCAFALVFFAAAMWLCCTFDPLRLPFSADNQSFYFVAERAASGVPPHVSLVNHKLALSMMLSGGAIRIGRELGVDDVAAVRALSMTLAAATVSLVWCLTLRLSRSGLAGVLGGAAMLCFPEFFKQGAMGVRPQSFAAFFMTLALLASTERKRFCAGFCAAASFLCWQPAAAVAVAVGSAALLDRADWRGVFRVVAGGVAAFALYETYFALNGILGEQLYQSFVMGLDTSDHDFPYWLETLRFLFGIQGNHVSRMTWLALGLFASLALWWRRAYVEPRATWEDLRARPGLTAGLVSAHLVIAFTFVDFQAFPDRFLLLPLYAVASGWLVAAGLTALVGPSRRPLRTAIALAIIAVAVVPDMRTRHSGVARVVSLPSQRAAAAYLDRVERKFGPIWAINCVHLLGIARRDNFDRFGVMIDPRVRAYMKREAGGGSDGYRPHRQDGKMPGVILVSRHGAVKSLPWLATEYDRLEIKKLVRQNIKVWVRRS